MLGWIRRLDPSQPLHRILLYRAVSYTVQAAITAVYRLRCFHTLRAPNAGALLIVANHQSHLDPPLVTMAVRQRHLVYIAREGLFSNRLFGAFISCLNAVPISETEGDLGAIRLAIKELKRGRAVVIFPEGSRSPDGALQPFKRGAWLLLSRAKCPVLPVAIEGAFDAWPRGRRFPSLLCRRVAVNVGRPIPPEDLLPLGPQAGLAHLARTVDDLRLELRMLLRTATAGRYPRPGPADQPLKP